MMRFLLAALGALALAGCTQTMYMKDPKTGVVAECGDHPAVFVIYAMVASGHDEQCVQDYKQEGYVRVPGPG